MGIYDAVEFRYWDIANSIWVPVQCDDELALMFGTNADSKSVQLEINVIQRKRGETSSAGRRSPMPKGGHNLAVLEVEAVNVGGENHHPALCKYQELQVNKCPLKQALVIA